MGALIAVQHLGHGYTTYQKAEGLAGALRDFFGRRAVQRVALRDLCFTVAPGERVGLLGPNGAGKTTLMKILAGLVHPSQGSVAVMGHEPYRKERSYLRQIGLVLGQKSQLQWDLPPADTFAVLKELYGIADGAYRERLALLTDLLGVAALLGRPVRKLSLGERMKFELIAALLHQPRLLLLDEPTIGLDLASQRALHAFLRGITAHFGTTMLITSHYVRDIEALADRLLIIKEGRLHFDGALSQLLLAGRHRRLLRVETAVSLADHPLGFRLVGERLWECEVAASELNRALVSVAQAGPLDAVTTQDQPLEEILYTMFADPPREEEGAARATLL